VSRNLEPVISAIQQKFSDLKLTIGPLNPSTADRVNQVCVSMGPEGLREVFEFLRHDERCLFEQVSDVTCVDYLNFPDAEDRFGVVYTLVSVTHGHRLWVKCLVNDPNPTVPSAVPIWNGADWLEREIYDLFGIIFEGHRDLRRIMTWDDFVAHPLRKDYPLHGRGEREDYPVITTESA
jgi:NADH-quinone oxidoreductase subunit C